MTAEAGLAALWLAGALAALQLALAALALTRAGAAEGGDQIRGAVRAVAIVQGLLAAAAMILLIRLFLASDMSVQLVVDNSHSAKPWLYKFAGAWGNHEGSMLLWVTILGLAGGAVALLERRLDERTLIATLGGQAFIALGFYAFLLFSSNPFARVPGRPPLDGNGLNPLLQDPGLAFHPPTLYAGYVGLSVAFSFAIGALITRDVGPAFARAMRPWVLGAWVLLTIGITAGSYWAYYELGWGGWWFWDPVENASLMPWLAATALLHSVTVLATRDGLRAWTIMLAVVAFSMSMLGTFLVRSGILTSVHAFAVDPERGTFILVLLAIYIGGALTLFGARIGTVRQGALFEPVSREGGLVVNNLLLSVILGIVLIGTLYPIAAAAFDVQLSVGPPFFDTTAGPIALILCAFMAAGPLIRWRRDDGQAVLARLSWPIGVAGTVFAGFMVFAPTIGWLPLLGLTAAAGVAVASILPLTKRDPRRAPLFTWGMVVAHFGIAVSLAGMASDSAFTVERMVAVGTNQPQRVGPFRVTLNGIRPVIGPNWSALEAHLTVRRDDSEAFVLRPQSRFFSSPPTVTSESAIATRWNGQLYAVLGQPQGGGRWQLRLWWKPFVTLIWLGGALIALGGALSLVGRLRREGRARRVGSLLGMRRWLIWLPLAAFLALIVLVASELRSPADRVVRSALVDKPLPGFALPQMVAGKPGLKTGDFVGGGPRLLNVFASWCVPCIAEAPQLLALKQAGVRIDAIAIRDTPADVRRFLDRHGDPYASIGDDAERRVQIALGSSGVPETFYIDGRGRIARQHVGDIRAEDVPEILRTLEAMK